MVKTNTTFKVTIINKQAIASNSSSTTSTSSTNIKNITNNSTLNDLTVLL